jgi:hypothetical protein
VRDTAGDQLDVGNEEDVMGADQEERGTPGEEQPRGRHSAPEGAERHPLVDLDRDPNPGVADHAKPDED